MSNAKPTMSLSRLRWEARCLFCGAGLPDDGEGFLDHVARAPACGSQYEQWVANLAKDWPRAD